VFSSPRLILGYSTGSPAILQASTGFYSVLSVADCSAYRAQMPYSRMTFEIVLRIYFTIILVKSHTSGKYIAQITLFTLLITSRIYASICQQAEC